MYPSKPKIVKDPYTKLFALARNFAILSSTEQIIGWDQETYMPSGAIAVRSLQLEQLASLVHKQKTSPAFKSPKLIDFIGEISQATFIRQISAVKSGESISK
jgi:carboxypeptidase Taq